MGFSLPLIFFFPPVFLLPLADLEETGNCSLRKRQMLCVGELVERMTCMRSTGKGEKKGRRWACPVGLYPARLLPLDLARQPWPVT
jgi:hypothetical protein